MSTHISQIRRGGVDNNSLPQGGGNPFDNIQVPMMPPTSNPMQSNQPPIMGPPQQSQNENDLVEDILREINGNPGDSNINGGAFQYTMDESQVPPMPPSGIHQLAPSNDNPTITDKLIEAEYRNFARNENRLISRLVDTSSYPWIISVVNGLLVFITLLLVSLPQINKLIFTFLPRLLLESGQVSFKGVLLKCVIGLIIYIVLSTVII